jgi:large exoprotein involved in heme utilization and adhesion
LLNGGQLSASNLGTGSAGGVEIKAGIVKVTGASADGQIPSRISASSASDFSAGFVKIDADVVSLSDRAVISVSSLGSGDAGNLSIRANTLQLDQAKLQSEVGGGTQGDINLDVKNAIVLRNGSQITTNASSNATGGNIIIKSPFLIGIGNSDIIANAVKGEGGKINITTQALLGLQYRDRLTNENDITASSEFGINGTVNIERFGIGLSAGLMALPNNLVDSSRQIAAGCGKNQGSSFILTGRGGMPRNPLQKSTSDRTWHDLRGPSVVAPFETIASPKLSTAIPHPIEASALVRNPETGQLQLVAAQTVQSQTAQSQTAQFSGDRTCGVGSF